MAELNGVSYKDGPLKSKITAGKVVVVNADNLIFDPSNTTDWLLNHAVWAVTPHQGKYKVISGHSSLQKRLQDEPGIELNVKLVSGYALSQAKVGEVVPPEELPDVIGKLKNQWKGGNGHARVRQVGSKPQY